MPSISVRWRGAGSVHFLEQISFRGLKRVKVRCLHSICKIPAAEAPVFRRVVSDDGDGGRHRISQGHLALSQCLNYDTLHLRRDEPHSNLSVLARTHK